MLRAIDKNIWVADQPLRYLGLSVGTRMTVVQLESGELAVISPIRVDGALTSQLNDMGEVRHIIAPNLYHSLFAADFKAAYPSATLWAVPGLQTKKLTLPVDATIAEATDSPWPGLDYTFFNGYRTLGTGGFEPLNECVFRHRDSRTLILTDAAFYFDDSFPLTTRLMTQLLGSYRSLGPSLLERVATADKEAVRQSLERVLSWDFDRVVMAHGRIVETGGKEKLRQGYRRF